MGNLVSMRKMMLLASMLLLAGCTSQGSAVPDEAPDAAPEASAPAGVFVSGPLLVRPAPDEASPMMRITGEVTLDGSCLRVNGNPAVWPYGSRFDPASSEVTTGSGEVVRLGETIYSGGASSSFDAIPRDAYTGEALDLLESCLGPERVVLDLHGPSTTPIP